MTKIYIPLEEGQNYACYTIYDKDTIRAYVSTPALNSSSSYTDYFINSHYLQRTGVQQWGNYSTNLPTCIQSSLITTDFYYRNDIKDILIIFIILSIFAIWFPYKLFSKIFGRWLKV